MVNPLPSIGLVPDRHGRMGNRAKGILAMFLREADGHVALDNIVAFPITR